MNVYRMSQCKKNRDHLLVTQYRLGSIQQKSKQQSDFVLPFFSGDLHCPSPKKLGTVLSVSRRNQVMKSTSMMMMGLAIILRPDMEVSLNKF